MPDPTPSGAKRQTRSRRHEHQDHDVTPAAIRPGLAGLRLRVRAYFSDKRNILRWVLGGVILVVIFANLSWHELVDTFATLIWAYVAVNLAIKVVLRVVSAWKWHLVRLVNEPEARFRDSLSAHFIGSAVSVLLPVAGTDLTVGYVSARQSRRVDAAISSILIDRLIGLYLVVILSAVALLTDLPRFGAMPALVLTVGGAVAGAVLLPVAGLLAWTNRHRLPRRWVPELLRQVGTNLHAYRAVGHGALKWNLLLSLGVQVGRVLSVYTLGLAVGAPVTLHDYAVVAPLMFLIMTLPIPAASIGLEQGVFVVMLWLVGVSTEIAFAMAVLNRILNIVALLPGVISLIAGWGLRATRPQGAKVALS
jgi:uncharacterized membrane protein YbhN (UPF0104 family)